MPTTSVPAPAISNKTDSTGYADSIVTGSMIDSGDHAEC